MRGGSIARDDLEDPTEHRERRGSAVAERLRKAVSLDSFFYANVSADSGRTREAVVVAAVSALVMGMGLMLMRIVSPVWWLVGAVAWVAAVLFGGAWLLVGLGRRFGGRADFLQILRPLGYAMAPQALGFIPLVDFIPGFVAGMVWSCACAVVAVREAHAVPTRLAVALVVAPLLVLIGLAPLVGVAVSGAG